MKTTGIIVSALTAAVIAGACITLGNAYLDRKVGNFKSDFELYVYPGMDEGDILAGTDSLAVRKRSLKRMMRKVLDGGAPVPGHYTITEANSSAYFANALKSGWQSPVKLVLSGTMRLRPSLARKISRQMLLDSADVMSALNDSALLANYGFTPDNVFSLFIPDTYFVYWTASMKDILDKQKEAYDRFWADENIAKAKAAGLTQYEVSILASIVNSETNYVPEMPSIAGVYLNRLEKGMPLQADPTVAYIFDYTLNRVYKKHLQADSPFNTYKHKGLPPAPICVPSRDALNAVLNADKNGYLYFCASPSFNGTHIFAATLKEHNVNAAAFRKALNQREAEKRKAETDGA